MTNRRKDYIRTVQQICAVCKRPIYKTENSEIHHSLHDTNGNNKNFPHYCQSVIAGILLHEHCHKNAPGTGHVPDEVAAAFEAFLQSFVGLLKTASAADVRVPVVALFKELEFIREETLFGKKK